MKPSNIEKKREKKNQYSLQKAARNMTASKIMENPTHEGQTLDHDTSQELEEDRHFDQIEQEPPKESREKKDKNKKPKARLNPIQNIHLRYKKFLPLQAHPMKNEFETPALLEKLKKLPTQEVKERPKFSLGNYDSYYNYRYEKRWQDPRLKLFKKEYFLNKDCLDIGCNDGSLTIMIAIKFFPKKILGVDIDYRLINKAITNLRYFERQQKICKTALAEMNKEKEQKPEPKEPLQAEINAENEKVKQLMDKLKNFPKSFVVNMGIPTNWGHNDIDKNKVLASTTSKFVNEVEEEQKKGEQMLIENQPKNDTEGANSFHIISRFPDNVCFQVENYAKDMNVTQQYDTILCLSTIKWIHFNWGDCGVRRTFKKVYDSLRPGGIFILEPQEWRSYKKRKYLTKEFKEIYKQIELRPNNFENYLVQRLGFVLLTKLVPDSAQVKTEGFKRTIFVFQKPA